MALHKTQGIVLRRRNLGEADRIVTVFTRKFGKLKAVAKGSRKTQSRLAGSLEPLQLVDFMFWRREGRELALVRSADLVAYNPAPGESLAAFAAGNFAAELVDLSLAEDEPQPRLFALLAGFLGETRHPARVQSSLLGFTLRAADALGYGFRLDRCAACDDRLPVHGGSWLDYSAGGLLCGKCDARGTSRTGERLSGPVLSAMRAALSGEHRTDAVEPGCAMAGAKALDRMLAYHQDRKTLLTEKLLGQMMNDE
jgi:DNA repair protein RecO (recombination protein O)